MDHLCPAIAASNITHLDISNNYVSANGGTEKVVDMLKNNGALTNLNISDNGLGERGAMIVAAALNGNKTMTELNLASNGMEKDGAIQFAKTIPTMGALTSLNIKHNNLGGYDDDDGEWISDMTGVQALAAAIPECK